MPFVVRANFKMAFYFSLFQNATNYNFVSINAEIGGRELKNFDHCIFTGGTNLDLNFQPV